MNQEFTKDELLQARERNNKSGKYKNDSIWESNQYGSFSIIGRFDRTHLYIQFVDTGAIYVRHTSSITIGNVKDLYSPKVYNKGFIGEGKYGSTSHKTLYNRWTAMLQRIYSDSDRYPTYNDCEVDEDWHNFQNFARDIEQLMREKGINNLDDYQIDKDIKSKDVKIYSKETVSLVTKTENVKEMHSRVHNTVYIAKNITTGEEIEFTNRAEFAREHNISASNISKVVNGERKTAGGWKFRRRFS